MKERILYQTLEDKSNVPVVNAHGPYFCFDEKAWLCPGFYFWEAPITIARWWGEITYNTKRKGYIVCKTTYDYNSENFFDLVGDTVHIHDFWDAFEVVKKEYEATKITAALVLGFLREDEEFTSKYKAVRSYPIGSKKDSIRIRFATNNISYMEKDPPIQLCVWENLNEVLKSDFKVVEVKSYGFRYRW